MFAVIDSGTTNSRIYLVEEDGHVTASASRKVGVRDTSITGSRDALRNGLRELFFSLLEREHIPPEEIRFAIASGMITSEIGLIELPHIMAPAGLEELSRSIYKCADPSVLPLPCPVYFIRGVRNRYTPDTGIRDLCDTDFMRGEEVQCVGILEKLQPELPCTIVVLSSHTKIICCNERKQIVMSKTTLSGQLREALMAATNIGKSLREEEGEESCGCSWEEILETADSCVEREGIVRAFLMPRFMQVLMKSTAQERRLFTDGAIAADDMKTFAAIREQGGLKGTIILFGHSSQCRIYQYLLEKRLHVEGQIQSISDPDTLGELTVCGVTAAAKKIIEGKVSECFE